MFVEEARQRNRTDEVIEFCNIMLTDGMKTRNVEHKIEVLDIAELVARSIPRAARLARAQEEDARDSVGVVVPWAAGTASFAAPRAVIEATGVPNVVEMKRNKQLLLRRRRWPDVRRRSASTRTAPTRGSSSATSY